MPADELIEAIDHCVALARHLHGLVQDAECSQAQELGLRPQVTLLPAPGEQPATRLDYVRSVLQQLADGRTALLQQLRSRQRELETTRHERDTARREAQGERKPVTPREALKRRINELVQTIGNPGAAPPPLEDGADRQELTLRLRQMEQEAEHRQLLVEKLIQKAFEQGDLITDLRERLDRINAMASSGAEAQMRSLRESMDRDEILVIPDEDPFDHDDIFP
jgi:hypothetical protein